MNKLLPFFAFIALVSSPTRAHAAVDYVLSGSGIFSCNDSSHAEPGFPVVSFSLGGSDPSAVSSSTGVGAGKISLSNLSISRSLDGCSETLIRAFLSQAHAPTLTLKAYRATSSGQPIVVLFITLSNAFVTSYQIQGSDTVTPQESVSFGYSKVTIQSTILKPDGTAGAQTTISYDVTTNVTS